jgi:hypothetical protein
MTAPRYVIAEVPRCACDPECDLLQEGDDDLLPVVPVGTSIRLEFTADGWVNRGELLRATVHRASVAWVDAPGTETTETDRTEDPC